jgi:DNA-binding transcriptional LysR family regulator
LTLTDAGQNFLPRARNLLAELAEARDGLSALDAAQRGLLTITAPTMFGRQHVAPAVVSFLAEYPHLEIELHSDDVIVDLSERAETEQRREVAACGRQPVRGIWRGQDHTHQAHGQSAFAGLP